VKSIPRVDPNEPRHPTSSDDLIRLAQQFNNLMRVRCHKCGQWVLLSIEARSLRLGSSPDLAAIDPRQPGRPRLVFYCCSCLQIIGFIQADHWAPEHVEADTAGSSRWDHLELDAGEG